tara:strand:- start:617 stop:787 length:171 start_codon:yes stop_codon:yes gene_type:complete
VPQQRWELLKINIDEAKKNIQVDKKIKGTKIMGTIPKVPVTKKGISIRGPLFIYKN